MAGTIEFIQSVVKTSKKEWEQKFPGIEDILIVHNSALEKLAPTYFQSYIDHADSAFYAMIRCNPLKGDCSRQMACKWLDEFMYEKCGCPSSYDIKSGMHPTEEHPDFGTMSRKVAISKELLPADNDAEYMDYYQEQMAKMKEMFSAEQKAAKKEEFIAKNGFDPDDPDIIDIEVDGEPVAQADKAPGTTSVEQSAGTAVGMPKPIWYGFVVHADGFGMKLGYDKKVWTLSQGATTLDKLGFDPAGPQLTEKDADEMVDEAAGKWAFIETMKAKAAEICGKYNLECQDISDVSISAPYSELRRFIRFYVFDRVNKKGGEIDLNPAKGTYSITVYGEKIAVDEPIPQTETAPAEKEIDEALIGRTAGMISQHILDAISLAGKDAVGLALGDVYEKFFGPLPANLAEKEADECEKCGDDSCKDGEKCGLNEVAGQDGSTPIAHPTTRNRMDKDPEYYVVVDQYRADIPNYDSKFVMPNMNFTSGVTYDDFKSAYKTTDSKKIAKFLLDVIKRYPTYNVALLRDNWTYAPVSFGGSAQRRPGRLDCWIHGDKRLGPGVWSLGAKYLKFLDRSIDFTLPTLQNVAEGEWDDEGGIVADKAYDILKNAGFKVNGVIDDNTVEVVLKNEKTDGTKLEQELAKHGINGEIAFDNGNGCFEVAVFIEDDSFLDDAREGAFETLKDMFPNATDEKINAALDKAYDNGDRVANCQDSRSDDISDVWADVAASYLNESKNPYDETDEETASEIKEILDEEDRGMEEELDEYAKIEDDVEEDDEDELSESVIRHATMLAREIR